MSLKLALACVLLAAAGCATPIEIKQATTALDTAYADNVTLMRQYRDTLESINQLHHSWSRHIKTRHLLNLAVQCATLQQDPSTLDIRKDLLGEALVNWVNRHRLAPLPAQPPFEAGTKSTTDLVQGLPELAALSQTRADAAVELQDLKAFDAYAENVALLRATNIAVKEYLDVDVTVSKEDVESIAEAIKDLGRNR